MENAEKLQRAPFVAPSNVVEEIIAEIWSELLEVDQVGRYDDFFLIGGTSLLAVQMMVQVRESLQSAIPLKTFFANSSLESFSELLIAEISVSS